MNDYALEPKSKRTVTGRNRCNFCIFHNKHEDLVLWDSVFQASRHRRKPTCDLKLANYKAPGVVVKDDDGNDVVYHKPYCGGRESTYYVLVHKLTREEVDPTTITHLQYSHLFDVD